MEANTLRIAVVSVHGCPLARLGERDTGGMNVYVLQLAKELGARGIHMDVFTRYHDPEDPQVVELGHNARVVHIKAGGWQETKSSIYPHLPEFVDNLVAFQQANGLEYDLFHSHYWLSGEAVALLNYHYSLPHIASFHTLGEAKLRALPGQRESALRIRSEKAILGRADQVIAGSIRDRNNMIDYYQAPAHKIRVIPCGVDMEFFKPVGENTGQGGVGHNSP